MGRPRNEEKYQNSQRMIAAQDKFNATGDSRYLFEAYDDFRHAIKSMIVKRFKGGSVMWGSYQWEYIDSITDDLVLTWFQIFKRRREKGNPVNMRSPISNAYFIVLAHYPQDDRYWLNMNQEDIINIKGTDDDHENFERDNQECDDFSEC